MFYVSFLELQMFFWCILSNSKNSQYNKRRIKGHIIQRSKNINCINFLFISILIVAEFYVHWHLIEKNEKKK